MKKIITLSALLSLLFTSCYVNRTTVGYGPVGISLTTETFSVTKQRYVLFGLVRINNPAVKVPPMGVGYEIKTGFSFWDGLLTGITGGIYGQRTVRILVERSVERDIKEKREMQTGH